MLLIAISNHCTKFQLFVTSYYPPIEMPRRELHRKSELSRKTRNTVCNLAGKTKITGKNPMKVNAKFPFPFSEPSLIEGEW